MSNLKCGYDTVRPAPGEARLVATSDMSRYRRNYINPDWRPDDNPMTTEVGDVVVAALLRWCLLEQLFYSPDPAIGAVAAGIVGIRTQLRMILEWDRAGQGWHMPEAHRAMYRCWVSGAIKFAGAYMHRCGIPKGKSPDHWPMMCGESGRRDTVGESVHNVTYKATNMYRVVGNCLPWAYCSSLSDDSGVIGRNEVTSLRDRGLLVKPTPKRWAELCHFMELLAPSGLTAEYDGKIPPPNLSMRCSNGNIRPTALVPKRTLMMLEYAAEYLRRSLGVMAWQTGLTSRLAGFVSALSRERRRYAIWAASVTPDLPQMMRLWDCTVAAAWDCFLPRPIYRPWPQSEGGDPVPLSGGGVTFMQPPWAMASGPEVPNIVPEFRRHTVLLHGE